MAFPTYFHLDWIARTETRWTSKDMCFFLFVFFYLFEWHFDGQPVKRDSLLLRDDNNNSSLYARQLPTYWNRTLWYRSDAPRGLTKRRNKKKKKQKHFNWMWMWSDSQFNTSSFVYFYLDSNFQPFFLLGGGIVVFHLDDIQRHVWMMSDI